MENNMKCKALDVAVVVLWVAALAVVTVYEAVVPQKSDVER